MVDMTCQVGAGVLTCFSSGQGWAGARTGPEESRPRFAGLCSRISGQVVTASIWGSAS